ncbi:MAG: type II toxin-antitoxin system prevent-host-death family antitoxin, partial [Epsilonproteobacteria bacterium]|nr:type II toxin-antitoxin system prevent-host-death family antitoxin [Campylobacterota bacterium]
MIVEVDEVKKEVLQKAENEDLVITKGNKPYLVVIDFNKYKRLKENDYDFWSEEEIKNIGKIGFVSSSFEDDGE